MDRVVNSMALQSTNETEMTKIIKVMRNKQSIGLDGITNKILINGSPLIDTVFAKNFNGCLEKQCFTKSLKIGKVVPFPEKGDRFQSQN